MKMSNVSEAVELLFVIVNVLWYGDVLKVPEKG